MKPEDIKWNDWKRIFIGDVPPEFYLELAIRGVLAYLLLAISMRLLGKRMAAGLSPVELCALVALGSAIGVPLLSPMNGMLPAFIITFIIVLMTRLIAKLSFKSRRFEKAAQGALDTLVEDGVMQLDILQKVRITRERLFAQLRSQNLVQLGNVKRVYMEPNGSFTLITDKGGEPGLMVLPDWDKAFVKEKVSETNIVICKECGEKKPVQQPSAEAVKCVNCGASDWVKAVVEKEN